MGRVVGLEEYLRFKLGSHHIVDFILSTCHLEPKDDFTIGDLYHNYSKPTHEQLYCRAVVNQMVAKLQQLGCY